MDDDHYAMVLFASKMDSDCGPALKKIVGADFAPLRKSGRKTVLHLLQSNGRLFSEVRRLLMSLRVGTDMTSLHHETSVHAAVSQMMEKVNQYCYRNTSEKSKAPK